ncbi:MAG: dihydropteroate synthase [Planctomycetota bacterium]
MPNRFQPWHLPERILTPPGRPLVMGILNATPDSFSDGGRHATVDAAIQHGKQMAAEGADIIDVGGESTRPYSEPVDTETEIQRVLPVIETLSKELQIPISIDTSKSAVAERAIAAGATILNDVTGLEGDAAMPMLAKQTDVAVCAMHMRGNPQTMQDDPRYDDVVAEITDYLRRRRDALLDAGLRLERLCLDPGVGFGKTHQHNWELVQRAEAFQDLDCPILIGHSRKGFIKKLVGEGIADRDAGTLAVTLAMAAKGISVVRVHEVRRTVAALDVFARMCV